MKQSCFHFAKIIVLSFARNYYFRRNIPFHLNSHHFFANFLLICLFYLSLTYKIYYYAYPTKTSFVSYILNLQDQVRNWMLLSLLDFVENEIKVVKIRSDLRLTCFMVKDFDNYFDFENLS